MPSTVRILQLNDVYMFDNVPSYATGVKKLSEGRKEGSTFQVLAGDFVAPSVLSRLDSGLGMVDVLGKCGLDYTCFGNHENDIPYKELMKRIKQSSFKWVNSNMVLKNLPSSIPTEKLPEYEIRSVDGKKIAFFGFLVPDMGLYPTGRFSGSKVSPIIEKAELLYEKLKDEVDLMVPISHQSIEDDRAFAKHFGGEKFPFIAGGHDHDYFNEVVNGCTILKVAKDAVRIGVFDVSWDETTGKRSVEVSTFMTDQYEADPSMKQAVQKHLAVLDKFKTATLFTTKTPLSSIDVRKKPSSLAKILLSSVREAYFADCVMVNAGSIRGSRDYPENHEFSYVDLSAEFAFPSTPMICVTLTGEDIKNSILFSRKYSYESPPQESGGYLQTCDALRVKEDYTVELNGEPINEAKEYHVGVLYATVAKRMDDIDPLIEAVERRGVKLLESATREIIDVVVSRYSRTAWCHIMKKMNLSFSQIDSNSDGFVTFAELQQAAGDQKEYNDAVLRNVWNVLDADDNGRVTPAELLAFFIPISTDEKSVLSKEKTLSIIADRLGPGRESVYDDLKMFYTKQGDIDLRKMLKEYMPLPDGQMEY
eukprot:TRINITY_DN4716_c3_g1_i1.p1 TRINITY_DN4716_c3_g1~~TRINITY_DN4716_c3_g1_i1.p1  ORF type:complete len:592 (+),score=134.69 TRINITY_DN4716_c3_g1_i1:43-1818(+)